jgi:hypothetical protein
MDDDDGNDDGLVWAPILIEPDEIPEGLMTGEPSNGRAASYAPLLLAECAARSSAGGDGADRDATALLSRLLGNGSVFDDDRSNSAVFGGGISRMENSGDCALAALYHNLWTAIDNDPWASSAIKYGLNYGDRIWPPSADDVVGIYASLVGTPVAPFEAEQIISDARSPLDGLMRLVTAIGSLYRDRADARLDSDARRRAVLKDRGVPPVRAIIGDWPRAVDRRCAAGAGDNGHDDGHGNADATNVKYPEEAIYLIITELGQGIANDDDDADPITHLVALQGASARLVGSVAPERDFVGDLNALPAVARPYAAVLPLFLDQVAFNGGDPLSSTSAESVEAIVRAMQPVTSWADLPPAALRAIDPWSMGRIVLFDGRIGSLVVWLDSCTLANALAQATAPLARARLARLERVDRPGLIERWRAPLTLGHLAEEAIFDAADARFDLTSLPRELSERLAFGVWNQTCTSPGAERDLAGHLVGADRLLDVAAFWGIEPSEIERARPDLLCASLAPEAISRGSEILRGRPSLPMPDRLAPLFGPMLLDDAERQAWSRACRGVSKPRFNANGDAARAVSAAYRYILGGDTRRERDTLATRWTAVRDRALEIVQMAHTGAQVNGGPSLADKARLALMALRYGLDIEPRDLVTFASACAALAPLAILWS